MTRSRILTSLAVTVLMTGGGAVRGEPYMDSARIQCVRQAQQYLFNDQYAEVDSIYVDHINRHPGDPLGHLFRAGALFAEMSDREENLHEDLFRELLDSVEQLTSRIIDSCDAPTAAWMYLLRGHAKAYRSLWESRFGSFVTALRLGLSTIDEYETGLKADPELNDLKAGTGSYHYWKSAKAGLLRWLGIFKDEKDKGIAELRQAADSSLLHRDFARSALIWVWLDRREYDSAAAMARDFLERYPESKTFRWPLAQVLFRQHRYEEAATVFGEIRSKLRIAPGNYYNLIQCDYHIAQCYNWLSDRDRTRSAARRLALYYHQIPAVTLKRQNGKINFLRRIARR